jgi:RNA recognition motif-containing protein
MSMKLYVGGLPYSINNADLERLFATIGQVISARVIVVRDTGRSKGFGFVEMANRSEGERAIKQLNGTDQGGHTITVNEARPEKTRSGGSGRGGFAGDNRKGGRW